MVSFDHTPSTFHAAANNDDVSILTHQNSILSVETDTNKSKANAFFSLLGIRIATYKDGAKLEAPEISKGFLDLIGCPAIQK